MNRSFLILFLVAATLVSVPAFGREFCTGDNCAPDVMALHFDTPDGQSTKSDLNVGDTFTVWVVVRNVESAVNAYSLGVAHEMDKIELVEGANSDEVMALNPFFQNFSPAVGKGTEVNDDPADTRRFGFVTTALLPVLPAPGVSLPNGATNFPLCSATFRVIAELGDTPSLLEIRNDLIPNIGAPRTIVNYSISGVSTPPREVFDGSVTGGGVVENCTDVWGLYFGTDSNAANHAVANNSFIISMRNDIEALGCSFGVKIDGTALSLVDREIGRDVQGDIRLVDLIITDNDGNTQTPATNKATGPGGGLVATAIELGSDVAGISDPFFQFNLSPDVGGPGFTIAYAADVSGSGATIPATSSSPPCTVNELFIVSLGEDTGGDDKDFSRADVNGDDRLNISDGAVMAQNIFFGRLKSFDCDDMLDANDDGTLDMADPVAFLMWAFVGTANLGSPFGDQCGQDPTNDALGCVESNCGA